MPSTRLPSVKRIFGGVSPFGALAVALMLAGCASLPTSGPTAQQVLRGTRDERNTIGMRLVDIDAATVTRVADAATGGRAGENATGRLAALGGAGASRPSGVVGIGDQLDITVFEVGATLFGTSRPTATIGEFDSSSQGQRLPTVTVDSDGEIRLPYAGTIVVTGRSPSQIGREIERAYRGKSQNPQVLVTIRGNISETVFVSGDVRRSGRIEVTAQRERLLDVIANAGGTVAQTQDMVVRVTRGPDQVEERLDRVRAGTPDDLVLAPGDRVELLRRPQTFIVLGATNRVAQVPFDQSDLTLAEAVARAGGPSDATANPRAVFLFRYEAAPAGQPALPTIYRLDLINPASYFIAQRFPMRDKDVLYISTAAINRTAKFVAIINQLFSPFVAARAISGN